MTYRLISEEDLEKLGLEPDNYIEPIWYFTEEKALKIYTNSISRELTQEEVEDFTDYLKAFIKVSPEELMVLDDYMAALIEKIKEMYKDK